MMQAAQYAGFALLFVIVATAMVVYEWKRIQAKRPLFAGHEIRTLYWVAYLSLFVLGLTAGLAALLR